MEPIRLLVQHGADLWIRNTKGDVALHEAIGSGRKDLTMWLLRQRSSAANLPNNDGRCPLHVAAINNNIEMCKVVTSLFISRGPTFFEKMFNRF